MLDSGKLITHRFGDNHDIVVYPIGDVHYGALEHMQDEWKAFCKKIERSKNTYIILNGDLVNNSIRSAKFANPFNELVRPSDQKRHMVEFLKPIQDKILCIASGNHEGRTSKEVDQDITYDIATKLDIEHLYRPDIAYLKLSLGTRQRDGMPKANYTFAVTHGAGGGGSTGAAINKNEAFAKVIDGLDAIVVAHSHKGAITKPGKIVIDCVHNTVTVRPFVHVICVPWLAYGGYAAKAMLQPGVVADPQEMRLVCSEQKKIVTRW